MEEGIEDSYKKSESVRKNVDEHALSRKKTEYLNCLKYDILKLKRKEIENLKEQFDILSKQRFKRKSDCLKYLENM